MSQSAASSWMPEVPGVDVAVGTAVVGVGLTWVGTDVGDVASAPGAGIEVALCERAREAAAVPGVGVGVMVLLVGDSVAVIVATAGHDIILGILSAGNRHAAPTWGTSNDPYVWDHGVKLGL